MCLLLGFHSADYHSFSSSLFTDYTMESDSISILVTSGLFYQNDHTAHGGDHSVPIYHLLLPNRSSLSTSWHCPRRTWGEVVRSVRDPQHAPHIRSKGCNASSNSLI